MKGLVQDFAIDILTEISFAGANGKNCGCEK